MTPLSQRHWLCALTIAALIHGGVALFTLRAPPDAGSVAAGAGGITMALGPAGRAPGAVQSLPPPTASDMVEQPKDVDEVMPADTADLTPPPTEAVTTDVPTEDQPTEPAETVVLEAVTPDEVDASLASGVESDVIHSLQPDTSVRAVEPDEVVAEEAGEAQQPEPVATKTADQPEPRPVQPEIVEALEVLPEETVASAAEPAQETTSIRPLLRKQPSPVEKNTEDQPVQQAGAGGEAGDQAEGDLGSGQSASGGGTVGGRADYFAVLQAWLEQHKVYPRRALSRRLEGVVSLRFVMNRDGKVLDYRIEESSGHRLLDHAVQTLIERAQPLPAMPDEMGGANLTLVVPISFVLN